MPTIQIQPLKFALRIAAGLLMIFLAVSFFTACGKADATSKKEKSKKSKEKRDAESEDEKADESEKSEEKSADENSNSGESKKETEKRTSEEKKSDKKPDLKTSEKDQKTESAAIWTDLMNGNKRFMAGKHTAVNYSAARVSLAKGQKPLTIVLGCADSRVPPEFVFDKNLGELFVVRDAGNIADEVSLGSIEYAVEHLHAKVLVILGHESCSAVAATVSGEKMPTKNLRAIVESIAPAFEDSKSCVIGGKINLSCVELNVKHSSENVVEKSPIIKEAVEKGELTIIRAVYKLETGEVVRLD